MKLGLKEPHPTTARMMLADYRTSAIPAPPPSCDWTDGHDQDWGELGNRSVGDCAIAAPLHQVMAWVLASQKTWTPFTDQQALAEYSALSGYDPVTGKNDDGLILADVMRRWQSVGLAGHRIDGWVDGQPGHLEEILWGASVFCGAQLGLALPLTAQLQLQRDRFWYVQSRFSAASQPDSWGRHAVYLVAFDPRYCWLVSWGGLIIATREFLQTYTAEVKFAVSGDFLTSAGNAPGGLDKAQLLADLALLGPVL